MLYFLGDVFDLLNSNERIYSYNNNNGAGDVSIPRIQKDTGCTDICSCSGTEPPDLKSKSGQPDKYSTFLVSTQVYSKRQSSPQVLQKALEFIYIHRYPLPGFRLPYPPPPVPPRSLNISR
jgi:hypothetical protein